MAETRFVTPETEAAVAAEAAAVAVELLSARTMREAARELRRSIQSLYADKAQGRLRTIRIGHKHFVPEKEIFRILLAARG